ncbi:MAG TPA: DUF4430 domain-containing protein [Prolixibacteraceae bacterium]|nr:DUF4430 domain-containing protein [Prolixibacteraceae bacterium]HPR59484.1 DUF4430 domain-containing protein [Prolixibacteraceae bacterium]
MSINKLIKHLGVALIVMLHLNIYAINKDSINVYIDFGGESENIEKTVNFESDITALVALLHVATVQTHPINDFVFVDEINGVENIKGKNAWYFTVNGKPAKTLAINCNLAKGDVVKWIYKKDVCSKTIETKEPCPDNFGL